MEPPTTLTATHHDSRSVIVRGNGNSWLYTFPVGSTEPLLQPGSPQWAEEVGPAEAERMTHAAKASAIVLAWQIGIVP